MSLLTRGTETVVLFPEETVVDSDGNTIFRPSATGVTVKGTVQPLSGPQIDGSATGYDTVSRYRLRLARGSYNGTLGASSAVEWKGDRYAIVGEGVVYSSSPRTAHADYVMERR